MEIPCFCRFLLFEQKLINGKTELFFWFCSLNQKRKIKNLFFDYSFFVFRLLFMNATADRAEAEVDYNNIKMEVACKFFII